MSSESPKNPSFLHQESRKAKGPHGLQSQKGNETVRQIFAQVMAILELIMQSKPQQTRKASASPLSGGPFQSVRSGPTPPPGAIRHHHDDEEGGR